LQIASNVDSRIAFALPFFKTEILAIVMPTFGQLGDAHLPLGQHYVDVDDDRHADFGYTVKSFSDFRSTALCKVLSNTAAAVATTAETKISRSPIMTPPAMSSLPRITMKK
jgi:hypothetical protein